MKKIDLHIHTFATPRDSHFDFSLEYLQKYVTESRLDAIAITNHDVFDAQQFGAINEALDNVVFPGIEVSLDCGHILIIGEVENLDQFKEMADIVAGEIINREDTITITRLKEIFGNLEDYLVIPHYDKKPAIKGESLDQILQYISAGEVDSAKKFIRAFKDSKKLTPVLFSDVRVHDKMEPYPTRHTFIDCGDLTLNAIKVCLQDKGKVALSAEDGNELFQVFSNGQHLSSGLNVLLGERSTGKTFTLDRIFESNENVQYIKQFALVQMDEEASEREFDRELQRTRSQFIEEYLSGFKVVLNDVMNINLRTNDQAVEKYVDSLLKSAEEADRKDSFSKTALFDESEFPLSDDKVLYDLIGSVRQIIENIAYREIITKHIDLASLKRLATELIELLWEKALDKKKKKFVNVVVRDIRENLNRRTSAEQVANVDLYTVCIEERKVERFSEIVKNLQSDATISEESIRGFSVVANRGVFAGASELKKAGKLRAALSDCFKEYERPYLYLQQLLAHDGLVPSELYKLFVKIRYRILNKDGFEVSGGERSEFRLLQQIKDAQNYDILLIDEPESSFDNLFLKSDVNQIIREISLSMPVVIVTHNSTVGASIGADYILYASREIAEGRVSYRIYSGHPTDQTLSCMDGRTISNHKIILNSLEAGAGTYIERGKGYEAIKD